MSIETQNEVWTRWRRGESLSAIGRAVGRSEPRMFQIVVARGGIAPTPRRRAPRVLQLREREEISRGLATGTSYAVLGRQLGRAVSTISREVRRHGGAERYRAQAADRRAWQRARRPKPCRLAQCARLRRVVADKLAAQWSPEQIAGWLKSTYAGDATMQVSHETIYRSLFIQSRGVLKQALIQHLRRRRTMRRAQRARPANTGRIAIADGVSIRERPAEVADRAIPGHWEGDLLAGRSHSQIATLVERHSRYVLLIRVPSKETTTVVHALTRHVRRLPARLRASLTWDRGSELAAHQRFTVATDVRVYFCDPYSPWQRGSNENTNGLLRQYLPRTRDLSSVTQAELNRVARRLNERPRKTLGFQTPADRLAAIVASTG